MGGLILYACRETLFAYINCLLFFLRIWQPLELLSLGFLNQFLSRWKMNIEEVSVGEMREIRP